MRTNAQETLEIGGNRWLPVAQGANAFLQGWTVILAPSVRSGHLVSNVLLELRIRRLGVRIPPSALQKCAAKVQVRAMSMKRPKPWRRP